MQVSFSISQKTLERLEWPRILDRLAEFVRTPQALARLHGQGSDGQSGTALFEPSGAAVRERLAETAEAHAILSQGDSPPIGGVATLAPVLTRARKGGALAATELLDVGTLLSVLHETVRFVEARRDAAPRLAEAAAPIDDHSALRSAIDRSLDSAGEVRNEASSALADARRDVHRFASEIQQRLSLTLQDPSVRSHLSDSYYTVRNDRYVLPVRADARDKVRGIVHDASRSGNTLFIEPEALVDLNNRHKQAELAVEQETHRVLRMLSEAVADAADALEIGLTALAEIDLAFARARLALALDAVEPRVEDEGMIHLPLLRHPLIPADEAVPNDLHLGDDFLALILSGPNAGGKTVTMKALALAVLFVRAGLFVPAAAPARVDLFDRVLADIGDEQDIREHLSTFSAHMANLAHIVASADERSLVVLDELGVGTDPGEGAAIGQAVLEELVEAGARIVVTTHYSLLKEMAELDDRFANASVEFDPETLAPTYRLKMGLPGSSSASSVAARMGLRRSVLERAEKLMSREDRRLDRMLSELSTSRAQLEREQREAKRLRVETEATRNEYQKKLERLQKRRDELFRSLRDDLDAAFREAHEEVARVVRELQRGGTPHSRDAERARQELLGLKEKAQRAEKEAGVHERAAPNLRPVDWNRARPGDEVELEGGQHARLVALPDRRGRVTVGVGSARLVLPMEQVGITAASARPKAATPKIRAPANLSAGGTDRCDLRGQRVDEALDRLEEALDAATREGRDALTIVHGVGTGALRRAIRESLARSPYVDRFLPGSADEGGEGVTVAHLDK